MSRWYRAYAGTVKDDKLAEVAVVVGCSRSVAIAVWHSILESAAETDDSGRYETTARRVAAALGEPPAMIEAAFAAMVEIGMLEAGAVAAWKRRQYESDKSTERSRKHRERQRNGDATLQGRCATPPDTETETEDTASAVSAAQPRLPYDEIERKCRKAAGLEQEPSPSLCDLSPIVQLLDKGADLDKHVLPILRARKKSGVRSWRFFVGAIVEAMKPSDAAAKLPPPKTKADQEASWRAMLKSHQAGTWSDYWGPPPGSAGCKIPPDFIASTSQTERAA